MSVILVFLERKMTDPDREKSVATFVNAIFHAAFYAGATHLHIEPSGSGLRIRMRVEGQLQELLSPSGDVRHDIVGRLKTMASVNPVECSVPQDGRMKITTPKNVYDIRASFIPTPGDVCETVVIHIL
jgi:type IV pilus assembly protein PilB